MSTTIATGEINSLKRPLTNGAENDYKRQKKEDMQYGRQYSVVGDAENLTLVLNAVSTTDVPLSNFWGSRETEVHLAEIITNPYLASISTQLSQLHQKRLCA